MQKDRWDRLGTATNAVGTNRTHVLNDFAAWYIREPGAKRPTRPDADSLACPEHGISRDNCCGTDEEQQ